MFTLRMANIDISLRIDKDHRYRFGSQKKACAGAYDIVTIVFLLSFFYYVSGVMYVKNYIFARMFGIWQSSQKEEISSFTGNCER